MDYQEFAAKAEALLVSTEYHELQAALTWHEPNLWHILGISGRENLISRFLAWLLDPKATHSMGDRYLKELLLQSLRTEAGRQHGLTPVEVLVLDLSQVEVQTEYRFKDRRRCDIVLSAPAQAGQPRTGFLCLIENKIWGLERERQTLDYYTASFEEFPAALYPHRVYLYLTANDAPPQSENFIPVSYQEVLQALENLQQKHQFNETELFLIQQFQDGIKRGIAMDAKTIDLAKTIYKQHQEVFDFIMQCMAEEKDSVLQISDRFWDGKSRFFNVGEKPDSGYKWADYWRYSFICVGGGPPYRKIMEQLQEGDLIYAYVSKFGYVGFGTVTQKAVPFREATLKDSNRLPDLPLEGSYDASDNDDQCDWIALVDWQAAVDKSRAVREAPFTVSTACKIYDHRQEQAEQLRVELARRAGQNLSN